MSLPLTASVVNELIELESVDSTNLELSRRLAIGKLENFSLVVSRSQTAGMGRLGRSWVSEPGSSISASLYLTSKHTAELGWATLIAAVSIRSAIAELVAAGFEKAKMLPINKHDLYPVVFASFKTLKEAQAKRKAIQKSHSAEAWLLID